jgi:hypothetical protein
MRGDSNVSDSAPCPCRVKLEKFVSSTKAQHESLTGGTTGGFEEHPATKNKEINKPGIPRTQNNQ